MRTLPPISDPIPIGEHLPAISAASPPELPPTARVLSHGLVARPHKLFTD
jgi:hypothetical protein